MTLPLIFLAGLCIVVIIWVWVSGRKRDDAWKEFASELGAEFMRGGLFRTSKVLMHVREYSVTLDTYSVPSGDSSTTYTRMRSSLPFTRDLQFSLHRRNWIAKLDKVLGTKEIEIGDPDFDHDFVIHGNNESEVKAVFSNPSVRQLLEAQRSLELSVKRSELRLTVTGVVRDIERLRSLFGLFKQTLDQLER